MSKNEQIEGLVTILQGYADTDQSADEILDFLNSIYGEEELPKLFASYHQGSAVFHTLLSHVRFEPIIIRLIQQNPTILSMPINNGAVSEVETLEAFIERNRTIYKELSYWLKMTKTQQIPAPSSAITADYVSIQKELRTLMKHNQFDQYKTILTGLEATLLRSVITKKPRSFLQRVLDNKSLDYLKVLVELDIETIRVEVNDHIVLSTLCENRSYNEALLALINTKYSALLRADEIKLLNDPSYDLSSYFGESQHDQAAVPYLTEIATSPVAYVPGEMMFTNEIDTKTLGHFAGIKADESDIDMLAQGISFDDTLLSRVNAQLYPDSAVLDAFLFQTLRPRLAEKGIALLPTISSDHPIATEQLHALANSGQQFYITGISIENRVITPLLEQHTLDQHINYAAWPICIKNNHYCLLIYKLSPQANPLLPRTVYFEPLRQGCIAEQVQCLAGMFPPEYTAEEIEQINVQFTYAMHLTNLIQGTEIASQPLQIRYLTQNNDESFCSDYVFRVLLALAQDDIDLTAHPESMLALHVEPLQEQTVRKIRMLQIYRFGPNYFQLQLQHQLSMEELATLLERLSQQISGEVKSTEKSPILPASAADETDASTGLPNTKMTVSNCPLGFFPSSVAAIDESGSFPADSLEYDASSGAVAKESGKTHPSPGGG